MATSAAPTFFEPYTFPNGKQYLDGGILVNNPSYDVWNRARVNYGFQKKNTVMVSIGTGKINGKFGNSSLENRKAYWGYYFSTLAMTTQSNHADSQC